MQQTGSIDSMQPKSQRERREREREREREGGREGATTTGLWYNKNVGDCMEVLMDVGEICEQ